MSALPDDTPARLLDAAGRVFADKGFEAATVRHICRLADVSNIAAVNYYFGDKERLYVEAVKTAFAGRAPTGAMPSWPEGTPAAARLRDFVRALAATLIGNHGPAWHFRLMARELSQPSEGCAAFVREFARPHFDALQEILKDVLPPGTAKDRLHLTALSVIGQVIYHRCAHAIIAQLVGEEESRTYDAARLAEHIADFSLAALGLRPPLARKKKHARKRKARS
jgi:AcrR family transcriptional regulator